MTLSDPGIKNAKSTQKSYKLPDAKGMYLLVNPNGSKYFRFDYRFDGKRKTLAASFYSLGAIFRGSLKLWVDTNCYSFSD